MVTKEVRGKLFIEKARLKYNDRYDYSKVQYVNNSTNVDIGCPDHGIFSQRPNDHLQNAVGCPICSIEIRARKRSKQLDIFIGEANIIHENKYDYSLVDYKNSTEDVLIVCPIHNVFKQIPYVHLNGSGCRDCGYDKNTQNRSKKEEVFLKEASEKFGDRFEYLEFHYMQVKIKCKEHNHIFNQNPKMHLGKRSKGGCPLCKSNSIQTSQLKSTDEFIKQAKEIHGDRYDYSLVEYKGGKKQIDIICKTHGVFQQRAADHTNGHSCRSCNFIGGSVYNITNANRNKKEWTEIFTNLYLIQLKSEEFNVIKIGISSEVDRRHHIISKTSGAEILNVLLFPTNLYTATILEQTILEEYKEFRPIFKNKFSGHTECLDVTLYNAVHKEITNYLEK